MTKTIDLTPVKDDLATIYVVMAARAVECCDENPKVQDGDAFKLEHISVPRDAEGKLRGLAIKAVLVVQFAQAPDDLLLALEAAVSANK